MEFLSSIIDSIIYFLSSFGIVGGFLLVALESFFPVFPLGIFVGLNILAFGDLVGYLMSYIATVCGAFLVFLLFRKVFKNLVSKLFKNKKRKVIERFISKITCMKFSSLVVILAVPFVPVAILNVAAGISNISWKKYLLALVIGKISIIYFWGFIGKGLLESVKDPKILITIGIMLVIAYVLSKVVEKIFKIKE